MAIWDDLITEQDRLVYQVSGYGQGKIGFGQKPALVIIDVTYEFVGDKPEPILESIKRFPFSCGEKGWEAVHHIASLLPPARKKRIPIFYAIPDRGPKPEGWLPVKTTRLGDVKKVPENNRIVQEIMPAQGDIVIPKNRSSIFFDTPFLTMLNALKVDTLLMCGTTTSGCVRACVVDAHSNNFKVALIEEATFDRGQASHKINLFDMNAKYADVVSASEVKDYIMRL